jgi:hypothetical protein
MDKKWIKKPKKKIIKQKLKYFYAKDLKLSFGKIYLDTCSSKNYFDKNWKRFLKKQLLLKSVIVNKKQVLPALVSHR